VIRKALVEIFLGDLRKKNQKPIEQQTNNLIEILTGKPQEPPPPILSEEEIVNLEKWAASNFKPLHDLRGRGLHNTINRSTYAFYLQTTSLSHEGKTHA
jgi:hypothetical protein